MRAALEVEGLKLRRAVAPRVAAAAVLAGVPGLAAAFMVVTRGGGDSPMAVKVRPMLIGSGWDAYLGVVAQILSVAVLLAVGVVVCWTYGRELTDGTFGALLATPTSPRRTALAKAVVLLAGGLALAGATVVVAVVLGLLIGLGAPGSDGWSGAGRVLVVGVLMTLLTLPLGWVASAARGYLPGIGALLGVVVATQVVTLAGAGAWFPYAAPGMWAGMGGAAAAQTVTAVQLALAVPTGAAGVAATAWWWGRAEAV